MGAAGIANLIGSVGFPVVVAGYLIMRLDATLDKQSDVLTRLTVMLDERLPHIDLEIGKSRYICTPKDKGGAA